MHQITVSHPSAAHPATAQHPIHPAADTADAGPTGEVIPFPGAVGPPPAPAPTTPAPTIPSPPAAAVAVARHRERGQTTAEYALVLVGAATIAMLIVAWAGSTSRISGLFDTVIRSVTSLLA